MKELALAITSQRLIGFTVPKAGRFFVCDHNEVWTVAIGAEATVTETDLAPYDLSDGRPDFVGWGDTKNEVRKVGQTEIGYDFDPSQDSVVVRHKTSVDRGEITFRTLSGDWFAASLSDDGTHLLLAEPYKIALFALT